MSHRVQLNSRPTEDELFHYLDLYDHLLDERSHDELELPRRLAIEEAVRYTRQTWLATLDELQDSLSHCFEDRTFKDDRLARWIAHGEAFGLREDEERERLAAGDQDDEEGGWYEIPDKPCNWSACLCAYHDAPHPMRLCMGCEAVYYCSKRCQTMCVSSRRLYIGSN